MSHFYHLWSAGQEAVEPPAEPGVQLQVVLQQTALSHTLKSPMEQEGYMLKILYFFFYSLKPVFSNLASGANLNTQTPELSPQK